MGPSILLSDRFNSSKLCKSEIAGNGPMKLLLLPINILADGRDPNSVDGCDSIIDVRLQFLTLSIETKNATCSDESNGQIIATASIPGNSYTYTVFDDDDNVIISESNQNETIRTTQSLAPGTYIFSLDARAIGCMQEQEITIGFDGEASEPILIEEYLCPESSITINGNTYSSDNSSGIETLTSASGCDSIVHINLQFLAGPETSDDVFDTSLQDNNLYDILQNDKINEQSDYEINVIEFSRVDNAVIDEAFMLEVEIDETYTGQSTVTYEICDLDCNTDCTTATVTFSSQSGGNDEAIITPNGDGYNDLLIVSGYEAYEEIPFSKINIINRWGSIVYSTNNYNNDWSGTSNGKPLPEGVYFFHVILGNGSSLKGSRSLIR